MALFASRPEEPSEWAGIPSEPRETGTPSEHLEAPVSAGIDGLFAGELVQSILIPIAQPVEVAQPSVTTGADDPETDAEPGAEGSTLA